MNKQVEVEGGELLLQSKEGHYAVIPAKHRDLVGSLVELGLDDELNSYINTLPEDSDYAADGTLLGNDKERIRQHQISSADKGKRSTTSHIMIHRTAGSENFNAKAKRLREQGLGAQVWINPDGTVDIVNELDNKMWHAGPWNDIAIGIEIIGSHLGGLDKVNSKGETYYPYPEKVGQWEPMTQAQKESLKSVVHNLVNRYDIDPETGIIDHYSAAKEYMGMGIKMNQKTLNEGTRAKEFIVDYLASEEYAANPPVDMDLTPYYNKRPSFLPGSVPIAQFDDYPETIKTPPIESVPTNDDAWTNQGSKDIKVGKWHYPKKYRLSDLDGLNLSDGQSLRIAGPNVNPTIKEGVDAMETSLPRRGQYVAQPKAQEALDKMRNKISNAQVRYEVLGEDARKRPLVNAEFKFPNDDKWHRMDSMLVSEGYGQFVNFLEKDGTSMFTSAKTTRQLMIEDLESTQDYKGTMTPHHFRNEGGNQPDVDDMDRVLDALHMVETRGGANLNNTKNPNVVGDYQWRLESAADPGYGVKPFDPKDPVASRKATKQYLLGMMSKEGFSLTEALMAYNWGPGAMKKHLAGDPKYATIPKETVDYIYNEDPSSGNLGILYFGGYDSQEYDKAAYNIEKKQVANKRTYHQSKMGSDTWKSLNDDQKEEILFKKRRTISDPNKYLKTLKSSRKEAFGGRIDINQ